MPGFQKYYEIYYFQIDQNKEVTPISILQFLEDIATSHSEAVGLGIDYLKAEGSGWVLNRWLLKMSSYPKLGDKILVETWPSKFDRFYGTREFRIVAENGDILGRASSLWIFLNLDKKRPMRIPTHFEQAYGLVEQQQVKESFQDFPEWCQAESALRFHVRKSDIDTNGHVNNTRYVEWMLEGITEGVTRDYQLSELEVIYKKETMYGADIHSEIKAQKNLYPKYYHRILDENRVQELALGRTVWENRK
jgi:medium-chain acyl-[acyl-carrier-protein] hydrolase